MMAKRMRATGLPQDQARVGHEIAGVRRYTGHQCAACVLQGVCDPDPPPGGPWEVMEAEPERATQCLVNPNIRMVPVRLRRIKVKREVPIAPRQEPLTERHVLLDANAIIEGAKNTFKRIIRLIVEPPQGFRYYTVRSVEEEVRFLPGVDRSFIFEHIAILDDPLAIDARILETRGQGINPPSHADAALWQVALEDPRFKILVSHDRFMRATGLARTLGIEDRLKVYSVDEFERFAARHR
jgi:hypothetical protein